MLEPDQKSTRAPTGAGAGCRLPAISLLFAFASCYGTLALVAVIGAFGISVRINNGLWGATITALTAFTWVALACSAGRHRLGPMLLGLAGVCVDSLGDVDPVCARSRGDEYRCIGRCGPVGSPILCLANCAGGERRQVQRRVDGQATVGRKLCDHLL